MRDMDEFYYSNYTQTCSRLLTHKRYENLITWATFPWPRSSKAIKCLLPYSWYHLRKQQRLVFAFPAESLGSANPPERLELVLPQNGRKENVWALRSPCVSPPAVSFKWWEFIFFVLSLFDIFAGILLSLLLFLIAHLFTMIYEPKNIAENTHVLSRSTLQVITSKRKMIFIKLWTDLRPKQKR